MRILYVTSEAGPYAASGGLGDVLAALPSAVSSECDDIKTDCILPLYSTIKEQYKEKMKHVADISFRLSWRNTGASIYCIDTEKTNYYFVENHNYFDRDRLYGEFDDAERFAFFSMAVVEFLNLTDYSVDILHANDWQSAMSIVYLKTKYAGVDKLRAIKTVYTIHNIEYQGKYDPYILGDVFGLDNEYRDILVYDGCLNLMKGAMILADKVTTVSPNYACELRHDFFAFGLSDIVSQISYKLTGIINGIDYGYFSPDKGGDIDYKYNQRTVRAGKAKNKKALTEELGLDSSQDIPLIVMITRLVSQKGIDLVLHIADELLSQRLNFVILGTGDSIYEDSFRLLEVNHRNCRALIQFDRALSKRLYASADMFLMPSKSEPCGLAQMISCAYGTVPIVRSVGGLCDTIIPYGNDYSNGFRFDNYNAHELLFTVKYAIGVFNDEKEWQALRKRAISSDFSWQRSALNYIKLYKDLLN